MLSVAAGCSSTLQTAQQRSASQAQAKPAEQKEIQIISDPPGARIEVNQDYVGDAPITIKVPQINGYFAQNTVIRALPTEAGDYVQTKSFIAGQSTMEEAVSLGTWGDEIPSRILFDTRLAPSN